MTSHEGLLAAPAPVASESIPGVLLSPGGQRSGPLKMSPLLPPRGGEGVGGGSDWPRGLVGGGAG